MATILPLKASNATILINALTYDITEATYDEKVGDFDATRITGGTNAAGLIAEEFGLDTVGTNFNVTIEVDSAAIKTLKSGRFYAVSYTSADGDVHSGTWACLSRSKPISTKGGYKVSCQGKFSGVVSGQ